MKRLKGQKTRLLGRVTLRQSQITLAENTVWRWQNTEKQRYYWARLARDLLGDLIITQGWGGLRTRRGGRKFYYCTDTEAAAHYLNKLSQRRQQRGYGLER